MGKNIVILTMGLEIGGAETHIVELAIALKNKGHHVTVFSNGGAYVERLVDLGIDHIQAPMNNKHPLNLWKSYRILKKFCKNNRVSVVHSHTRITNFIGHNICKHLRIPMVTTVHGRFRLGAFARIFSKWGDRAIAVSEDLRQYVIEGYGMSPDKVGLTVNGIDIERFSRDEAPELRAQHNINAQDKVILCVTRVDPDASESAFRLLDAAPYIYDAAPHTKIIIVGGGKQSELLQKRVNEVNSLTNIGFVQAVGSKTNISNYLHMADIFVGVSRAALEAMACEIPAVLIGNGGYLGPYSAEIHDACIDTNFTCRGHDHITSEAFANTLLSIIKDPTEYEDNVKAARRLVEQRYSVLSMAEDALQAYIAAEGDLRPNDLMLSGYYGTHNFGDDITLNAIIQNISKKYPVSSITILNHSKQNEYSDERIRVIHRFDLRHILPMMRKTKLFMLGGGSLLQDVTSNRSIFFYLFMLRFAQKLGCKTMIYGNGIGPIVKKRHKKQLLKILRKVDQITIRDNVSYNFLLENGLDSCRITLTADEAYNYDISGQFDLPQDLQLPQSKKILLINLRNYSGFNKDISKDISAAIDAVAVENNLYPVLMPVQFSQDFPLLNKVSSQLNTPHHIFDNQLNEKQIIALIQKCDYMLTERLHPIIFAGRMQKPFVCIVYDPKVSVTANKFKMQHYAINLDEIDANCLKDRLTLMLQNSQKISESLAPIAKQQRESALLNSNIAGRLLHE